MRLVAALLALTTLAAAGCRDLRRERRVAAAADRFVWAESLMPPRYSRPACVVLPALSRFWESCIVANLETGAKVSFVCSDESCAYEGET